MGEDAMSPALSHLFSIFVSLSAGFLSLPFRLSFI
jgi:hypothetical protein